MADREMFDVVFEGENAKVFREFGGHRFEDEEVAALQDGKVIMFKAHSNNTGNDYNAIMRIGRNEKGYIGTILDFDLNPDVMFSATWCGYDFSRDECDRLMAGEVVQGHFKWKSGKESDCGCEFAVEDDSDKRRFRPVFDD